MRLILLFVVGVASIATASPKIGVKLARSLENNPFTPQDIMVSFSGIKGPLSQVVSQSITDRVQRTTSIYNALLAHANEAQKDAVDLLNSRKFTEFKSFWITNQLYVKGADSKTISLLANLGSVSIVDSDAKTYLKRPLVHGQPTSRSRPQSRGILAEWNVEKVGAHLVWDAPWGNNGSGVTVGFIDTGVRGTHEAIRDQYKNDGKAWRDPYNQYSVPTDVYNHGTHTVGSVLGKFGIGMAPGAQWIACKGYQDDGGALTSAFTECGQFMVCPTSSNGQNPDCSKTPHVTSNSWGVWPGSTFFEDILDVWNSAGILSLFSMGNEGPDCADMLAPADSVKTIGVGATGQNDDLANFSSRGPSRYGVLKPDISAPGVGIRSCDCRGDSLYISMSGTSMSCPNAAGVAALMVAKNNNLGYERFKNILTSTAVRSPMGSGQTCDGVIDTQWPNNSFGFGVINAYDAVQAV